MTSLSSKVIAIEIVATHMTNTTSYTEIEIEYNLNIMYIGLALCISVKVLPHTIQFPSLPYFDVYRGKEETQKYDYHYI